MKCDGTRAETRFRLSAKLTNPFKSAVSSVQSTTGSRGVRISDINAGYTMLRGSVKSTGYSIRQFPLHFPSRVSPCVITFQLESTDVAAVAPSTNQAWPIPRSLKAKFCFKLAIFRLLLHEFIFL